MVDDPRGDTRLEMRDEQYLEPYVDSEEQDVSVALMYTLNVDSDGNVVDVPFITHSPIDEPDGVSDSGAEAIVEAVLDEYGVDSVYELESEISAKSGERTEVGIATVSDDAIAIKTSA